jgi:hypothetical protein
MDIATQGLHVLTLQKIPEICFSEQVGLIVNKK